MLQKRKLLKLKKATVVRGSLGKAVCCQTREPEWTPGIHCGKENWLLQVVLWPLYLNHVFVCADAMHTCVHTSICTDNKQAKKHFLFKMGGGIWSRSCSTRTSKVMAFFLGKEILELNQVIYTNSSLLPNTALPIQFNLLFKVDWILNFTSVFWTDRRIHL